MSELGGRCRSSLDPLQTTHLQSTHFVDEANRRIANHLAMLAALLRVRAKSFGQVHKPMSGEDVRFVLEEFAGRLETVGKLNRGLASMANGPPIDIAEYLADIAQGLVSSLTVKGQIALDCEFPATCVLPVEQAATLGLLIGKLITNAVKYAHPAGVAGAIKRETSKRDDATIAIEVSDDGVGLRHRPAPKSKYRLSHDPYARKADWSLNFVRQLRPWTELPLETSLHLACAYSGLMKSRVKPVNAKSRFLRRRSANSTLGDH
jgi:two-component sensor histidine kinase